MPMEQNPDYVNDAKRQLQERVIRSGEGYAADNAKSKELNASRTERRKQIKDMGFRTDSYQQAIYAAKNLTPNEAKDFFADMKTIYGWLVQKQKDLFPEEQLAAQKREQKRKEKEKRDREAQQIAESQKGVDPSTNPRSDPKRGGAGGANGRGKAKDKPAPKAAKNNVVPLKTPETEPDPAPPRTPGEVTKAAGQSSDAMVKEAIARQAQKDAGQPGDGSAADLKNPAGEQAEGDAVLNAGIAGTKSQSQLAQEKRDQAGIK